MFSQRGEGEEWKGLRTRERNAVNYGATQPVMPTYCRSAQPGTKLLMVFNQYVGNTPLNLVYRVALFTVAERFEKQALM